MQKQLSIKKYLTYTSYLFLFLILINIPIYLLSLTSTKKFEENALQNSLDVHFSELENKSNSINRFLTWTVVNDQNFANLTNSYAPTSNLQYLKSRTNDLQETIGSEYYFFVRFSNKNFTPISHINGLSYESYLTFQKIFNSKFDKLNSTTSKWTDVVLNGKIYFFRSINLDNKDLICLVSAESLVKPLQQSQEKSSIVTTVSLSKFANPAWKLTVNQINFDAHPYSFPFYLHYSIDSTNQYQTLSYLIVTIALTLFLIVIIFYVFLNYSKRQIIKPIETLINNINIVNKDMTQSTNKNIFSEKISITEFDNIQITLNNLLCDVKNLETEKYQLELQSKKIEVDFLKTQIRPHFYLNCLTTIHNMITAEMYSEVNDFIITTANYFRYLFQHDGHSAGLEQELTHLADYMSISASKYGDSFTFLKKVNPLLLKEQIPVLVLDTFAENVFKYSITPGNHIFVTLKIDFLPDDRKYFYILFSDNGPGFPQNVIEEFAAGNINQKDGTRIGINNVYHRLKFLFDTSFDMKIFNNESDGGATIFITLPVKESH